MAKTKEKARGERAAGPRARNDAYVMLLFIALAAFVAATVFMYLDFDEYGSKAPPKETIPTPAKLGEALKGVVEKAPDKGPDDGKPADPKPDGM